jgi:hypothetical protein
MLVVATASYPQGRYLYQERLAPTFQGVWFQFDYGSMHLAAPDGSSGLFMRTEYL